jgi:hypothetical protein
MTQRIGTSTVPAVIEPWRETVQSAESLAMYGFQRFINRIESDLSNHPVDSGQAGEHFLYNWL